MDLVADLDRNQAAFLLAAPISLTLRFRVKPNRAGVWDGGCLSGGCVLRAIMAFVVCLATWSRLSLAAWLSNLENRFLHGDLHTLSQADQQLLRSARDRVGVLSDVPLKSRS